MLQLLCKSNKVASLQIFLSSFLCNFEIIRVFLFAWQDFECLVRRSYDCEKYCFVLVKERMSSEFSLIKCLKLFKTQDNTEASVTEHHVGSLSSPVPVLPSIGDARHSISESFPSHTLEDHHEVAVAHTSSPPPVASQDHTSPPPPLSQVDISTALPSYQDQAMPPEAQTNEEAERPEKSNPDLQEEKTDIKETIDSADTTSPSIADHKTQTDTESETDGGVAVESSDERRQSSDTDGFSDTYDGEVLLLDSDDDFSELIRVLVAVFVR